MRGGFNMPELTMLNTLAEFSINFSIVLVELAGLMIVAWALVWAIWKEG